MSEEVQMESEAAPAKRPIVSPVFLVIVVLLGIGGYFAGPSIMTMFMLQQEKAKVSKGPQAPEKFAGLSQLAKDLQSGGAADGAAAFGAAGSVPAEGSVGATGGEGGGGGRGQFDPEERFAEMDANGDGKLQEDEMSDRMKQRSADADSDGDGAVSKEEFMEMVANFRGGGGRGQRGGRPAGEGDDAAADDMGSDDDN